MLLDKKQNIHGMNFNQLSLMIKNLFNETRKIKNIYVNEDSFIYTVSDNLFFNKKYTLKFELIEHILIEDYNLELIENKDFYILRYLYKEYLSPCHNNRIEVFFDFYINNVLRR